VTDVPLFFFGTWLLLLLLLSLLLLLLLLLFQIANVNINGEYNSIWHVKWMTNCIKHLIRKTA
jgi:hypothetical protein